MRLFAPAHTCLSKSEKSVLLDLALQDLSKKTEEFNRMQQAPYDEWVSSKARSRKKKQISRLKAIIGWLKED